MSHQTPPKAPDLGCRLPQWFYGDCADCIQRERALGKAEGGMLRSGGPIRESTRPRLEYRPHPAILTNCNSNAFILFHFIAQMMSCYIYTPHTHTPLSDPLYRTNPSYIPHTTALLTAFLAILKPRPSNNALPLNRPESSITTILAACHKFLYLPGST